MTNSAEGTEKVMQPEARVIKGDAAGFGFLGDSLWKLSHHAVKEQAVRGEGRGLHKEAYGGGNQGPQTSAQLSSQPTASNHLPAPWMSHLRNTDPSTPQSHSS